MKGESRMLNQEVSELDISGATSKPSSNNRPETEEVIKEERNNITDPSSPSEQTRFENTSTYIPYQSLSREGVLNLKPEPSMKHLPHRHNEGIPKTTYEP